MPTPTMPASRLRQGSAERNPLFLNNLKAMPEVLNAAF
jgi:hypothetical protein